MLTYRSDAEKRWQLLTLSQKNPASQKKKTRNAFDCQYQLTVRY